MEPAQNNSGGSVSATTMVLFVAIAGIGGYLIYKAGKSAAATAAGAAGVNTTGTTATGIYPTGQQAGAVAGTAATGLSGLINSIGGLFTKKTTQAPAATGNTTIPKNTPVKSIGDILSGLFGSQGAASGGGNADQQAGGGTGIPTGTGNSVSGPPQMDSYGGYAYPDGSYIDQYGNYFPPGSDTATGFYDDAGTFYPWEGGI